MYHSKWIYNFLIDNNWQIFSFIRIVDMDVNKGCITIHNPKGSNTEPPRNFTFDAVYDWK